MGRKENVHGPTLQELRKAVKALGRVERQRDEAILRAYLAGNSLRVIARVTSLSHESVRTIIERMQEWARQEGDLLAKGVVHGRSRDPYGLDDAHHARRAEHLRQLLDVKNPDS